MTSINKDATHVPVKSGVADCGLALGLDPHPARTSQKLNTSAITGVPQKNLFFAIFSPLLWQQSFHYTLKFIKPVIYGCSEAAARMPPLP
jgi:hypothetical protein